jgi:hypothetical protein
VKFQPDDDRNREIFSIVRSLAQYIAQAKPGAAR